MDHRVKIKESEKIDKYHGFMSFPKTLSHSKCKQPNPEFELSSPSSFFITIILMPPISSLTRITLNTIYTNSEG